MAAPILSKFTIRPANRNDLSSLAKVCSTTFIDTYDGKGKDRPPEMVHQYVRETFTPDVLGKDLDNNLSSLWVGLVDEKIIGYFKLIKENPPAFVTRRNLQQLERIYVLGSHHGRGFGKQLLKRAEEVAKENRSDGI